MRQLFLVLAAVAMTAALLVAPSSSALSQAGDLWSPLATMPDGAFLRVHLFVLDVSQSMLRENRFELSKPEIARCIDQAPSGTYLLLARFGTTADIVGHGFLLDRASREALKTALAGLHATHRTTNMDEAAKLIEWVLLKLEAAYPGRFSLNVAVFTDELPDPDPDKAPFALRAYLEKRGASPVRLIEVALGGQGAPVVLTEGEQYVLVRAPVTSLLELVKQQMAEPVRGRVANDGDEARGPQAARLGGDAQLGDGAQGASGRVEPPASWASRASVQRGRLVLLALVLVGLACLALGVRRKHRIPHDGDTRSDVGREAEPRALLVTEEELPGQGGGEPRRLRQSERVPIGLGAAATFGTGPNATCVIEPIKGIHGLEQQEIFSVTPAPSRVLYLKTKVPSLLYNGRPVSRKGLRVVARRPFRLQLKNRVWAIQMAEDLTERGATDALFTRIQAARLAGSPDGAAS